MNQFTEEELNKIAEAIEVYAGDDIEHYTPVRTAQTSDDFKATGASFKDIRRGTVSGVGWTADEIQKYQYVKGEPRVDLLIVDLGEIRAVIVF